MSRHTAGAGRLIKWLTAGLLLGTPLATAGAERTPPRSILLFVASWCAPCHAELARLPAITRGARPFRVLVVPFDDSPATSAMMEGVPAAQRWRPDRERRRRLVRDLAGETSGLPFSVATDGEGHACGSMRQGLDGPTAEALVTRCLRQDGPG